MVEARDEPSAYRILSDHEDDWRRAGGGLRGRGGRVPTGDQDRHGEASQLGRECAEPLIAPASPAILDVDVALVDISSALETAEKRGPVIGSLLLRPRGEKTHYRTAALLLRRRRERPTDCGSDSRRKLRRLIRSPRRRGRGGWAGSSGRGPLAVLRLMERSNLIGCWTGRSAGFAPFKIRST
jgi:hypothetical protein